MILHHGGLHVLDLVKDSVTVSQTYAGRSTVQWYDKKVIFTSLYHFHHGARASPYWINLLGDDLVGLAELDSDSTNRLNQTKKILNWFQFGLTNRLHSKSTLSTTTCTTMQSHYNSVFQITLFCIILLSIIRTKYIWQNKLELNIWYIHECKLLTHINISQ